METEKIEIVCELDRIRDNAYKDNEKFELLVKENMDLKAKLEELSAKQNPGQNDIDVTPSDLARKNADLDRIKFLYEKVVKDNAKLEEQHKKEVKELVSKKLESDYRLDIAVKEKEKLLEKERILLNTFDIWKSKI